MSRTVMQASTTSRLLFLDKVRAPDAYVCVPLLDTANGMLLVDAAWQTRHPQIALLSSDPGNGTLQGAYERIRRRCPQAVIVHTPPPGIDTWAEGLLSTISGAFAAVLSVQPLRGPMHHFSLGRALRPLVDEGLAVVAAGALSRQADDSEGFIDWIHRRIEDGDVASLAQYRALGPHVYRHQPTGCDLLPLFLALGATPVGTRWRPLCSNDRDIGLVCGASTDDPAADRNVSPSARG